MTKAAVGSSMSVRIGNHSKFECKFCEKADCRPGKTSLLVLETNMAFPHTSP